MRIRQNPPFPIASFLIIIQILILSGCWQNCSRKCRKHSVGCFEGTCECEAGYVGDECEILAGSEVAGNYDVLALGPNQDSLRYQCAITADPDDVTKLTFSNLHGVAAVAAAFEPLFWDSGVLSFELIQQSLGAFENISGDGYFIDPTDQIELSFALTGSIGIETWTARFTRR